MILTAQTSATIKEPKASDPIWYLKIHFNPDLNMLFSISYIMEASPFVSELWEKYQVQQATMIMNWEQAMMKAMIQRIPKARK